MSFWDCVRSEREWERESKRSVWVISLGFQNHKFLFMGISDSEIFEF